VAAEQANDHDHAGNGQHSRRQPVLSLQEKRQESAGNGQGEHQGKDATPPWVRHRKRYGAQHQNANRQSGDQRYLRALLVTIDGKTDVQKRVQNQDDVEPAHENELTWQPFGKKKAG